MFEKLDDATSSSARNITLEMYEFMSSKSLPEQEQILATFMEIDKYRRIKQ